MTTPRPGVWTPGARQQRDEPRSAALRDGALHEAVLGHLEDFLGRRSLTVLGLDADFADEVFDRLARFVLDGGKRIRPTFAWWGWRAAGGAEDGPEAAAALRAASALELVQAFALLQDDVMDRSAVRRGRPAVHVEFANEHRSQGWFGDPDRYGESAAVLASDLALVWAEDMFTGALRHMPDARERAREPWLAMHTEMVVGQFLDLRSQVRSDAAESTPLRVNRLKTAAYSAERPLHLGASLADASEETVSALRRYGEAIGSAYQLRDDLLDLYGETARTGKAVGADLREGKRTLILAVGLRRARERGDRDAVQTLDSAIGDPGLTDADVRTVADLLAALGARKAVEQRLAALLDQGTGCLTDAPITPVAREELRRRAHGAIARMT
ncbi:polyprenyl synthetase family protein [Streptomonospora wellingtoniae]|uniref:Polyprenyl synthetase family protein n=1 Tax=Streptomonospora wellingtoniae TaxID=3075544 RepID=A0ABU2KP22_9ACTN|nr:polyprenyl synthetase family protein [Streptomonospora sp. DSM 45055]MDT0300913.1 polyprenyl synthetase family protein [Streptomonospora sp. DSM 45055]